MREGRGGGRTALACLLAGSAWLAAPARAQTDATPADPPVAGGLRVEPAPGAPGISAASEAGGFGWTLAPVRWGGSLASELRRVEVRGEPSRVQRVDSAETRAATYVWQPWFVQLSGGLGVLSSHDLSGSEGGAGGPYGTGADSTALTGHGTLAVFPASRFPFLARYERTDSRTSSELANADFTSTRYGVRQDYRPAGGSTSYALSHDRSVYESGSFGRDTLDVWDARMLGHSGAQQYDANANRARNSRSTDGESQIDRLSVRHSYREGTRFAVETLASANDNEFREANLAGPVERRSRVRQFSTFTNWRPADGSPWYVTGGGRVFQTESEEASLRAQTRTMSGNLGANYQFDRHTTLSGIASVTEVLTDTRRDVISAQGLNVTHVPDAIALGPYQYSRNLSAGGTRERGAPEGERRTLNAQFTHNVTRSFPLQSGATAGLNLAQSVAGADDSLRGGSTTVLHSVGASWSASPAPNANAYASLTAADSRRRGADENDFQLINFQANGQFQFSRHALGTASFTSQGTRAQTPVSRRDGFDVTSSGSLAYQHARAFGVPRLRYSAIYTANDTRLAARQLGDLGAPVEQVTQSLEQRLEYDIGRLETRLLARVAEVEGRRNTLVFLRVTRRFGTY